MLLELNTYIYIYIYIKR